MKDFGSQLNHNSLQTKQNKYSLKNDGNSDFFFVAAGNDIPWLIKIKIMNIKLVGNIGFFNLAAMVIGMFFNIIIHTFAEVVAIHSNV